MAGQQTEKVKVVYFRPQGPQGGKIGVRVESEQDMRALDEAIGALPVDRRRTIAGVMQATRRVGLQRVD